MLSIKEYVNKMTEKEIREIRRRFRHNKNNITAVKGCIVDREKNIKSYIYHSMINSVSDDCDKLLSLMKKVLSGSNGTNRYELEYTAQQVMESEEHRFLLDLRDSKLNNDELLNILYQKIIESLNFETEYAILIFCDDYDVFSYSADGEREENSTSVFSYMVCAVCPVKEAKPFMYYSGFDNSFRLSDTQTVLANPELGFMFPTFDDRATNIYKAQLYSKNTSYNHPDFIKNVFNVEIPKAGDEQKESFNACLCESFEDNCDMEMIKSVHEHVSELVREHKDSKEEEPLTISKKTFSDVFASCGVAPEKVEEFETKFEEEFGKNASVSPEAVVDVKKFEVVTPYVSIKVSPDRSDLVSTRIIDGSRYILIRANDNVEVNGVSIDNTHSIQNNDNT